MGKYNLSFNYEDHDLDPVYSQREIAIQTNYVANELAEHNRLKKLELQVKALEYTYFDSQVAKEGITDKIRTILEDGLKDQV